ncbi:hypothetical protein D3C81_1599670 [compost metagenome]
MATHGSGMAYTATFSSQRCLSTRWRVDSQKNTAVSTMKNMPRATIMRNVQNNGATCGTVSHAAFLICSSVA